MFPRRVVVVPPINYGSHGKLISLTSLVLRAVREDVRVRARVCSLGKRGRESERGGNTTIHGLAT